MKWLSAYNNYIVTAVIGFLIMTASFGMLRLASNEVRKPILMLENVKESNTAILERFDEDIRTIIIAIRNANDLDSARKSTLLLSAKLGMEMRELADIDTIQKNIDDLKAWPSIAETLFFIFGFSGLLTWLGGLIGWLISARSKPKPSIQH